MANDNKDRCHTAILRVFTDLLLAIFIIALSVSRYCRGDFADHPTPKAPFFIPPRN